MRVLIDTNIIIGREDYKEMTESLQKLFRIISKHRIQLLIHPCSVDELKHDKDEKRRTINLSKIGSYEALTNYPQYRTDSKFLTEIGGYKDGHDGIDNEILYAIYKDAVDFLVTEDRGIISKAIKLNLDQRVFNIIDAYGFLCSQLEEPRVLTVPSVTEEYIYNISIDEPILDALRKEYSEFELWWRKISKEGRKAWVYRTPGGPLGAILIFKIEDEGILSNPPVSKKKRLKICTLKVDFTGNKIGELFLKMSFDYAIRSGIYELYLTHFTIEDDALVALIEQYGFVKVGEIKGESIYLKQMVAAKGQELSRLDVSRLYYPSYCDGENVGKYIVPIIPGYHSKLFTDYQYRRATLLEASGMLIVEGNTITKAYLCHSQNKSIAKADIIMFYRSQDQSCLTTIGVVHDVYNDIVDPETILRYVGRRTVFSPNEIERYAKHKTKIIIFRQHFHFRSVIPLTVLTGKGILSGPPQSITKISHSSYLLIKQIGGIDGRFTVN